MCFFKLLPPVGPPYLKVYIYIYIPPALRACGMHGVHASIIHGNAHTIKKLVFVSCCVLQSYMLFQERYCYVF